MKRILFLPVALLLLVGIFSCYGFMNKETTNVESEINWVSIEEAAKLAEKDNKKIIVDFYTHWCGWCKRMDRDTYAKKDIVKYINDNYHAVKFNAEQKEEVKLKEETFKFVANGRRGYHELAASMMGGQMSYPTTVFLNPDLSKLVQVPGYKDEAGMLVILCYLNEGAYGKTPFNDYNASFKKEEHIGKASKGEVQKESVDQAN